MCSPLTCPGTSTSPPTTLRRAWRGALSHIRITESFGCTFVIAGTSGTASDGRVRFTYTDSTGQLTVLAHSGNLHFWNVSAGCLGGFNDGDRATLSLTFTVSPEQAITSP